MKQLLYLLVLFLALPAIARGGDPPEENAKPGVDGPHVFYRGGKIVVKSVEANDTGMVARTTMYDTRASVLLTCNISEKNKEESFSFELHDTLTVPPDQYPLPAKMLALSDIEGDFPALKTMLIGAKVMNRDFTWRFGTGHLVLVGDYFDRGSNVTECLWLIYKLEAEAEAAGGKVHFILGNHEILNLQANVEYVRHKYLANAQLIGEPYKLWFDNNSELGRWLRTKNAVEKIGDYVFCHGGISPELARTKLSLSDINRIARQNIGKSQDAIAGANAQSVYDVQTGIFWYRNAAKNQMTAEQVDEVLRFAGARRMVIGHTLVSDVTALYGGKVICIDLYHEENMRRGFMKSLWIEDGFCYGIDSRGEKTSVFSVSFSGKQGEN